MVNKEEGEKEEEENYKKITTLRRILILTVSKHSKNIQQNLIIKKIKKICIFLLRIANKQLLMYKSLRIKLLNMVLIIKHSYHHSF